jgi:hypothetical protein
MYTNPIVCIVTIGRKKILPEKMQIKTAKHPYSEKKISSRVVLVNGST